jgi:hypothetical protein
VLAAHLSTCEYLFFSAMHYSKRCDDPRGVAICSGRLGNANYIILLVDQLRGEGVILPFSDALPGTSSGAKVNEQTGH